MGRNTLPDYARGTQGPLVLAICRGRCRRKRVHRLERPAEPPAGPSTAEYYAGCTAYCLKCGSLATDHYNWHSINVRTDQRG